MTGVLVGSTVVTSTASTYNVPLTSLTGGEDTTVRAGDYVFVFTGYAGTADGNPGITSFTGTSPAVGTGNEIVELYRGSTHDTNLSLTYFFAQSGWTGINVTGPTSTTRAGGTIVAVFRGITAGLPSSGFPGTWPYDAYETAITGTGSQPSSANYVNSQSGYNIWLYGIFTAVAAGVSNATYSYTPDSFSGGTLLQTASLSGSSSSCGLALAWGQGYKNEGIGVAGPAGTFTCNFTAGTGGSYVQSLAYAPEGGGIRKMSSGGGSVRCPVKYYNGTKWITKPVKYYNGTSWKWTNL